MQFDWDETKNIVNIRKHGIDFSDVPAVFDKPMLILQDNRNDYGEVRWVGIGLLIEQVSVVIYTECDGEVIRIISVRKATKREVKGYVEYIKN